MLGATRGVHDAYVPEWRRFDLLRGARRGVSRADVCAGWVAFGDFDLGAAGGSRESREGIRWRFPGDRDGPAQCAGAVAGADSGGGRLAVVYVGPRGAA